MSDLVKRIRQYEVSNGSYLNLFDEAADRIEALEAALRKIEKYWDAAPVDNSEWNIWAYKVREIARAVFTPEKDK